MNTFVKLVRLVQSRVIFSLLTKEFKEFGNNRLKSFYNFYMLLYLDGGGGGGRGDFGKVDKRTVTISL